MLYAELQQCSISCNNRYSCYTGFCIPLRLTWGLASSAPTSSTQSACEMQMRDQGVTAASASRMMNLQCRRISEHNICSESPS